MGTCLGGMYHGESCHSDSECPGTPGEAPGKEGGPAGTCSVPSSCVTLHVVRCRYCAQGQDSLSKTAREYGVDMNWYGVCACSRVRALLLTSVFQCVNDCIFV